MSWLPIQESGTVQESLVVSPAPCRAGLFYMWFVLILSQAFVTTSISQVFLRARGLYKGTKTLYLISKSMLPYVTLCYPLTLCFSMLPYITYTLCYTYPMLLSTPPYNPRYPKVLTPLHNPGDISCGEEVHTQNLTSDQTIANITDLTPGCCYDVTVFLNTGFAMTENRDVSVNFNCLTPQFV